MTSSQLPPAFRHPYSFAPAYRKSVAYFSMEFAVDQALKVYSGGLGFLAGSHMKSAFDERQNLIGIGMLWKYGYYDQIRRTDNAMDVQFREKIYGFLQNTGVRFSIDIAGRPVWVEAYYLDPKHFNTVPMFFLTTDVAGNDTEARSITYRLYDADSALKVSQCMVLGLGGAKFLDQINYAPEVYHLNEAHALSAAFHLYQTLGSVEAVRDRMVFTTHTPEEAGNEKHDIGFLQRLGFFGGLPLERVRQIAGVDDSIFNHSLVALRLSRKANGVSKLHGEVSRRMWGSYAGICEITHVTNAQNHGYWADTQLDAARSASDSRTLAARKKAMKKPLFNLVADQVGKLFDPNILTIVWARRFAGYKRPDLLTQDGERFRRLMNNRDYPVQMIWAGKPYPFDEGAVRTFNHLYYLSHLYPRMAVLTGYELALSKALKDGADVWMNTPIVPREASGTSGMTAAMNGAINLSTNDGWICEFAKPNGPDQNAFIVPTPGDADFRNPDAHDREHLYRLLEEDILPMYYDRPEAWRALQLRSMADVNAYFTSARMAREYYERVY
ncbi:alpha-glucan family phosphorylase [Rudanella paleaurantiibacter]|uniref:Alpha-glucan family phosphorylase n=1 Tax=Rudanella paleaurantiibacter TaxID=2614655 RepID=A0A7J5U4L2_9BACT|nr:alpha-glucan family phosphorylase [Rudanella paleaurantiibacter]KAB7732706.1 alpha-glucan family phosphorylase [Rudanella paleaurantiibacter]